MKTRRDFVLAILVAFCLTATLFSIIPVGGLGTYDPWLDVNGDGKIDLKDYYTVGKAYGTLGDPTRNVNVTNTPLTVKVIQGTYTDAFDQCVENCSRTYSTHGYKQVILYLCSINPANVYVDVYFNCSTTSPPWAGAYVGRMYARWQDSLVWQKYEVIGGQMFIEFRVFPAGEVYFGIYMSS